MNELHTSCAFCLHGSVPRYLQEEVNQPVAEVTSRRRLRSSSCPAAATIGRVAVDVDIHG